jgi:tripartite motif-containing protein 71
MDLNPSKRSNQNIHSRVIIVITFATLALIIKIVIPNGLGLEESYIFVTKWGSTGKGDGQFRHPHGIDVDSSGNLYVTVRDNMEVQKFTRDGTFIGKWESNTTREGEYRDLIIKEGKIRTIFRTNVTRDGEFLDPHGIDVDSFGNVYVVDALTLNVQKFTNNGTFITKWGVSGTGNGEFRHPHDIIHDSFGNVYVTDYNNSNIQKFDSNGTFITKWGVNGTGNGEFRYLESIGIDSNNNIYVADTGNDRIQKFDSNGTFITKWGVSGTGNGEFRFPYGIAVDSLDNVYVSDRDNSEVQKFTNDGTFITKWGVNGTGNGEFYGPEEISVDLDGNLYVTDSGNDRIQKFSPRTATSFSVSRGISSPVDRVWSIISNVDNETQYWSTFKAIRNINKTDNIVEREVAISAGRQNSTSHQFVTIYPEQMKIQTNLSEGLITGSRILELELIDDNKSRVNVIWNIDLSGIPIASRGLAENSIKQTTVEALLRLGKAAE